MKTAIIFLLLIALGAAAYFTRPTQDNFRQYVIQQKTQGDNNPFKQASDQAKAEQFADACTFSDRLLWVDVQKDGKTIYSGAFSHWFSRDKIADEVKNAGTKVKNLEHKAESVALQKH